MSFGFAKSAVSFDPAQPGTSNLLWQSALEGAPCLPLPSSHLLVVSPHPDDEVLGAGGLICSAAQAGRPVTVVSITDGEAAYRDWQGLGTIRRREVSDALRVLAPQIEPPRRLGIPDGQVDSHRATLFDAIDRLASKNILIVAPYEQDGHPDHNAAGEVCAEVARMRHLTLWRYPIWAWHHSSPERFEPGALHRFALDAAAQAAKKSAIRCFTSQLRPLGREPIVPSHVLEYFTRSFEAFLI